MLSVSKIKTQLFAKKLAQNILKAKNIGSKIICLSGELGSGKTTFTQGFAKGLGIKARITSPTFLIIRRHPIPQADSKFYDLRPMTYKNLFHLDLYHINNLKEILDLGFKKIVSDPKNIVIIEWAEKIKKFLSKNAIWIYLEHGKKENTRSIRILRIKS